ncbi:hypothetical protein BDV98DRAFT_437859 [Pterulicium gracile]|uniref:C2H2-type domain-containing protein n=1 Tax=Pterulicium gracile TaxID=1884261 RepID=A0A5C3QPE0_9AGAR|nr:hypothetical protein BDV98DRAFT_437859 [Pterula gracilis]
MPKRRRISIDSPQPPPSYSNEDDPEHDIREFERSSIVNSELDLEILLHERLAQRLEGRLQLADHLIGMLDTDNPTASTPPIDSIQSGYTLNGWQNVKQMASDALKLIDGPTDFLFAPPPSAPPRQRPLVPTQQIFTEEPIPAAHALRNRPERSLHARKVQFLYTQPQHTTEGGGVKVLRCPDCLRTSFTSLQGLLNHARLSHKVQYASHDECVWACAVPVEELMSATPTIVFDTRDGLMVGTSEGAGKVRGLKRLFEDAVGVGKYDEAIAKSASTSTPPSAPALESQSSTEEQFPNVDHPPPPAPIVTDTPRSSTSTAITRALGHHADTPALAPFLGKEVIKQGIRLRSDEEASVNVDAIIPKRTWRKPFEQRNTVVDNDAQQESYMDVDPPNNQPAAATEEQEESAPPIAAHSDYGLGTRFYIPVRLVIVDHSRWVPAEKLYKWMLTIDSPGYSAVHISTFVTFVKVTDETDTELDCQQHPFYFLGTTTAPFLAKLEIHMVSEQVLYAEHWVDIDPLQRGIATLGDEQIRDFGLDRKTVLRPAVHLEKATRPSWDVTPARKSGTEQGVGRDKEKDADLPHEKVLKQLAKRYPMTMREYKRNGSIIADSTANQPPADVLPISGSSSKRTRSTRSAKPVFSRKDPFQAAAASSTSTGREGFVPGIPYRLLISTKGVVMGRRKAIEWARARAIQEAYTSTSASRSSHVGPDLSAAPSNEPHPDLIPLSVGDVYAWLEDNGHFTWQGSVTPAAREKGNVIDVDADVDSQPGPSSSKPGKRKGKQAQEDEWCTVCGLLKKVHPSMWRRAEMAKKRKRAKVDQGVKAEANGIEQYAHSMPTLSHVNLPAIEQQPTGSNGGTLAGVKVEEDVEMISFRPGPYLASKQEGDLAIPKMEADKAKVPITKDAVHIPIDAEPTGPFICDIVTAPSELLLPANSKTPLLNIQTLLDSAPLIATTAPPPSSAILLSTSASSHKDLTRCVDPQIINSIASIVSHSLRKPSPLDSPNDHNDLPRYAPAQADLVEALAPYSLLGILTKSFMNRLLGMGVRVAAGDMELAKAGHISDGRDLHSVPTNRKRVALGKRLLLPSHIVRGLGGALRLMQQEQATVLGTGSAGVSADTRIEQSVAIVCSRLGTGMTSLESGLFGTGPGSDSTSDSAEDEEDDDEEEVSTDGGLDDGES